MLGEKNDLMGMKKGGKIHIFFKKYEYFFPNRLKTYKIAKKG